MTAIHLEGLPQVRKMIDSVSGRELQNRQRRAVRAAAKPMQAALKVQAATPGHPRSFTKVPAAKVTTRGGTSGRDVEARVRPKSPLFNIFEPGAGSHTIKPRRKKALGGPAGGSGWSAEGRKRPAAFFARGPVSHPGFAARPILPAAFAAGEAAAMTAFEQALFTPGTGRTLP
jgi:hypothetical protein